MATKTKGKKGKKVQKAKKVWTLAPMAKGVYHPKKNPKAYRGLGFGQRFN